MFRADEREAVFHGFSYLLHIHFKTTSPTTQFFLSIVGMRGKINRKGRRRVETKKVGS